MIQIEAHLTQKFKSIAEQDVTYFSLLILIFHYSFACTTEKGKHNHSSRYLVP